MKEMSRKFSRRRKQLHVRESGWSGHSSFAYGVGGCGIVIGVWGDIHPVVISSKRTGRPGRAQPNWQRERRAGRWTGFGIRGSRRCKGRGLPCLRVDVSIAADLVAEGVAEMGSDLSGVSVADDRAHLAIG